MNVHFANNRLARLFNSQTRAVRQYGERRANLLLARLIVSENAPTLSDVSSQPPIRRHQLTGNRNEQFAVQVDYQYRLVFQPDHDPVPRFPDGGIDLAKVTAIVIVEVTDYHPDRRQR